MKGSSFTRPSTDHAKPLILLGVGRETNFVTWEGELWVEKRAAIVPPRVTMNLVGFHKDPHVCQSPGAAAATKATLTWLLLLRVFQH